MWCLVNRKNVFVNENSACLNLDYRFTSVLKSNLGIGVRRLTTGLATLPKGNQEPVVVKDKIGRPPGELGVSKSMECDIYPFNTLKLLVGRHPGHPAFKIWFLVYWWCGWWCVWRFACFTAPIVTTTCSSLLQ